MISCVIETLGLGRDDSHFYSMILCQAILGPTAPKIVEERALKLKTSYVKS